jgi:hypothetical protein
MATAPSAPLVRVFRSTARWLDLAGKQCCVGRSQLAVRRSLIRRAGVDPGKPHGRGGVVMTTEERVVRNELAVLAADERGRHLLQLALRGIQESGRGLSYGCWIKKDGGVSGCLFQHAYWQGESEGLFAPVELTPKGELKDFVGEADFALVLRAIRAFDALGRRRFLRWQRGPYGLPRRRLDEPAWRAAVERILVDVLAGSPPARGRRPASVPST